MGAQLSRIFAQTEVVYIDAPILSNIENHKPFNVPTNDSIVNSIISQFISRSAMGYKKYGTTLDRTDLSLLDWIQHAQEEMMDGILYLEKIKNTEHRSYVYRGNETSGQLHKSMER
jgi:hypothetical protein|tara:strand:- start:360 stop:707 length:348 start_codon:yes stop_codon:yes gene_type:complete